MRGKKEPRRFLCTHHFSFFLYVLIVGGGEGGGADGALYEVDVACEEDPNCDADTFRTNHYDDL